MNAIALPSGLGDVLPCPLCNTEGNRIVITELGTERRFGMPVVPASDYRQARCRGCGLLYLNAPVDPAYLTRLYEQESVEWAKGYTGQETGAMNADELARFEKIVALVARLNPPQGCKWLDVGCQTGELGLEAMKRFGAEMSGVEVSSDYAARSASSWGRPSSAVSHSIEAFAGQQFDVISSLETLEHLADPWRMVRGFRQLIKPDGLLIVTVPSSHYFWLKYHVFKLRRRARKPGGPSALGLCHTHVYNFTVPSLTLLLEQNGFKVVGAGGSGWAARNAHFDLAAELLNIATGGRVHIYPSVFAVAHPK